MYVLGICVYVIGMLPVLDDISIYTTPPCAYVCVCVYTYILIVYMLILYSGMLPNARLSIIYICTNYIYIYIVLIIYLGLFPGAR